MRENALVHAELHVPCDVLVAASEGRVVLVVGAGEEKTERGAHFVELLLTDQAVHVLLPGRFHFDRLSQGCSEEK